MQGYAPQLQTVYSLRAFSSTDLFHLREEFDSTAHLALVVPIYLLPHLFIPSPVRGVGAHA